MGVLLVDLISGMITRFEAFCQISTEASTGLTQNKTFRLLRW